MAAPQDGENEKTIIMAPGGSRREQPESSGARLVCLDASLLEDAAAAEIPLAGEELTLGRGDEATVVLRANGISRLHARLRADGDGWSVEDLGSTNGIKVNRAPVQQARLQSGDVLEIGNIPYRYTPAADAKTPSAHMDLTDRGRRPAAAAAGDATAPLPSGAGRAGAAAGTHAAEGSHRPAGSGLGVRIATVVILLIAAAAAAAYLLL